MKIKNLFILAALTCSSSLFAMDMDNPGVENHHVSWGAQPKPTGEIMEELLSFRSRTTGKIYELNMRHNWALKDYIRQLKRDEVLSKTEGTYNYNAQYFFIKNKSYSGDVILSYENVCELSQQQQAIEFKFR